MSKSRDQLAKDLHALLTRWRHQKGADEYYELPLRSPYKEQVVSPELNRFGGGMGAYSDSTVSDIPGVSYINATPFTFEEDEDQNKKEFKYIGTMCPKINTFDHFWRMVWHKNTRVIVNLTHEEDQIGSEPGDKRERYWPPYSTEPSPEVLAEWPLVVETVGSYISDSIHGLYVYTIKLTHKSSGETRNIRLFWYSSWIDFGDSSAIYDESFKENALNVLKLANEVDIVQSNEVSSSTSLSSPSTTSATSATSVSTTTTTTTATTTTTTTTTTTKNPATEDSWLVVHCSAGVGRTGTFITLLRVMHKLNSINTLHELGQQIVFCIVHLRRSRLWMVKTDGEFATIFTCFWHLFTKQSENVQRISFSPLRRSTNNKPLEPSPSLLPSASSSTKVYDGVAFEK